MFFGSLIRIVEVSLKSLWLHKLRSGLTMLGMIIGVGAVIALVAVGEGASHDAQERFKSTLRAAKHAQEEPLNPKEGTDQKK